MTKISQKIADYIKEKPLLVGLQAVIFTFGIIAANGYYARTRPVITTRAGIEELKSNVSIYPATVAAKVTETFTVSPLVSFMAKQPGFVELALTFNPEHLELIDIDNSQVDVYEWLGDADIVSVNDNGRVRLLYGAIPGAILPQNALQLAKLSFRVLKPMESAISVDTASSQIAFMTEDIAVIVAQSAQISSLPVTPVSLTPTEIMPEEENGPDADTRDSSLTPVNDQSATVSQVQSDIDISPAE
ncbi:hypothetical protein A2154_05345 [Candidatus Gottesmanbacteria bacterium RBG_16_43_7]|uniref:Cohesin domain-containing protein n=1 Tax=Candidatus Gottesmanbacteria bacterium RBG_16_43_7 TaxID=1798373 RepID=A0A1F5ZBP6_9BACT|nr:MAG: hypothetical protein A2154_05345 [Candidatus Gottesmanbacteria bacterium RBG_16_43_7]